MRIPGTEQRTAEDRDCTVTCACGAKLMTLGKGQRLALRRPGVSMDATCSSCGKTTRVQVEDAHGQ